MQIITRVRTHSVIALMAVLHCSVSRGEGSLSAVESAPASLPREIRLQVSEGILLEMVLVPDRGPSVVLESTPVPVRIDSPLPFYISRHEVSQRIWENIMGSNPSLLQGADRPVDSVSWFDCRLFCERLSFITGKTIQIPLKDEWLYALALGESERLFSGGAEDSTRRYKSLRIGAIGPDLLGLFDMIGGVSEWCADGPSAAFATTKPDPMPGFSVPERYLGGGWWNSHELVAAYVPRSSLAWTGFRLVMGGNTQGRAECMRLEYSKTFAPWETDLAITRNRALVTLPKVGSKAMQMGRTFELVDVDIARKSALVAVGELQFIAIEGGRLGPYKGITVWV